MNHRERWVIYGREVPPPSIETVFDRERKAYVMKITFFVPRLRSATERPA